jgi:hypothetical protein
MRGMKDPMSLRQPGSLALLPLLVICASLECNIGAASDLASSRHGNLVLAQNSAPAPAPQAAAPAPSPAGALSWTFGTPSSFAGDGWTAERGTMTAGDGNARLQPDANRRVVLLSPPGLPDAARRAEEFVLGVSGTGLQRVRIQGRRDARGGWITIADASGGGLLETTEGYSIKRNPGARDAPIERLRVELTFMTTNPRALTRIAIL